MEDTPKLRSSSKTARAHNEASPAKLGRGFKAKKLTRKERVKAETKSVQAKLKGAAISAQKARLVADLVRGKPVGKALDLLTFNNKKAAVLVKKCLESAIANAEHNKNLDVDRLNVTTIYVDEGTSLKRIMPRAKGRADRITKRTCHITVKVGE